MSFDLNDAWLNAFPEMTEEITTYLWHHTLDLDTFNSISVLDNASMDVQFSNSLNNDLNEPFNAVKAEPNENASMTFQWPIKEEPSLESLHEETVNQNLIV